MKLLFCLAAAFILLTSATAQSSPGVHILSNQDLVVTSSHLAAAPGGGTYVSGISQPTWGVSAPAQPHIHIIVYDRNGRILLEKIDTLNRTDLAANHYSPRPRAIYTVYLPVDEALIGGITISPHTGHHHLETKNLKAS